MSRPVARMLGWPIERRIAVLSGAVAIAWAVLTLAPLGQTTIDPDASASVLFFQRIVAGQHLEAFVPTTPKPLLTLIYGLTWTVGHDWRWLTWETIAVFGAAVGAAAALVARLAGRIGHSLDAAGAQSEAPQRPTWPALAGAAFVVAGLLGSSDLLLEVSRANSLVWALAFWLLAGLAVTVRPARPWLAGLALFLAGLCRFETFAIDAAAVAVLVASIWWRGRTAGQGPRASIVGVPRARRLSEIGGLLLAFAALPVAMLHDWLLTANPLWFLSVPAGYTAIYNAGLQSIDPVRFAGTFAAHEGGLLPLAILAVLGLVALVRANEAVVAPGIASLAVGVIVLLFVLAARATYISNRYYEPLELAVIVAAAVGAGAIALAAARALAPRSTQGDSSSAVALGFGAMVGAAAVGIALTWAPLPFDRSAMAGLAEARDSSQAVAQVMEILRSPLQGAASAEGPVGQVASAPTVDFATATVLVPSRDVSRVAVEDDGRVTDVADLYAFLLHATIGDLKTGQYVFHDSAVDRPVALFSPLELGPDEFATVQGVQLETRFEAPQAPDGTRAWLLMVR